MPEIQFGSLDAANRIRNNPQYQGFVAETDNARSKTVELKAATPESALEDIQGEASDTREHKAEEYGQAELTRREKQKIDFSETNVMHARSVKAIAQGKGVDDWTAFYEGGRLTVDEHRDKMERATRDETGRRGLGQDQQSDAAVDQRYAQAHKTKQREELGQAKEYAFTEGDRDAQDVVRSKGPLSDVTDISFSRTDDGRLRGTGQDYERLQQAHENRSGRARTLDEKKSAQPTRDPFEWRNNPGKYDYPGIDTVQPDDLHEERSPQARARDERDAAPVTENKQQWALNPGRYDYEGVDDVDPEKLHAARSERAREQDESELAPIADSKQQWAQAPGRWDWRGVDTPSEDLTYVESGGSSTGSGLREVAGSMGVAPGDFEPGGNDSLVTDSTDPGWGLAGGEEADMAFVGAERDRAQDEIGALMDDRPENDDLTGFGMETDATQHRESREAVEAASEFGIDDRSADAISGDSSDVGEQRGFEEFGGGTRENETLF